MIIIILIAIVILLLIWGIVTYNRLITERLKVQTQWSQIDVVLKQRFDLIPNLVETVKGYAAHENEALQAKIAQMEDVARQADSVSRENDRLRKMLDLQATHESYDLVDAYIIGWGSTDWNSTLTINRGSTAGIKENLCAITENGQVIGLVTEVGLNYAVIKTVLDSTLEISGTISVSGYNGMVKGGYIDGHDRLLKMNYLPSAAIIRNNDQVVTSGSTVYPRGLIIGSVVDAGFEETGVAKFALLEPAAEINALEQVFIITNYTTEVSTQPSETQPSETQPTEATTPIE